MDKIVIATTNRHKIDEFKAYFKNYEVLSLKDIGFNEEIDESGDSFFENAYIKAKAVCDFLNEYGDGVPVIADDSGLCVDALGGEPGVHSARYVADHDTLNRDAVLMKMKGKKNRKAHFVTVLVKMFPNGEYISVEGKCYGKITSKVGKSAGDNFEYDTIFLSDDLGKLFSEVSIEEKNSVSCRIRAVEKLIEMESEIKSI